MSSRVWGRGIIERRLSVSPPFLLLATMVAVLVGGAIASLGLSLAGALVGALILTMLVVLRQDEVAATAAIAVHLCIDWYLGLYVVALVLALGLLLIFFLFRSTRYPWVKPRAIWLWVLFLVLTIYPAIRGALTPRDTLLYYPNVVFGALAMFWLGTVIARSIANVRRLFQLLSFFGALIALHTLVQAVTGTFLFESSHVDAYLASVLNYQLVGSGGISRLGSFFIQPDFSGIFFATMVFLPLGLFAESTSLLEKGVYAAESLIMLPAMLVTYSTNPWIAASVGLIAFVVLVGRMRYRLLIPLFAVTAAAVLFVGFPTQASLLLQHASDPTGLLLRAGIWQTALRVIGAFPLTGVGLGHQAYLQTAEAYRVAAQLEPVDHPHNSYLEWGAMAGLPVLFVFLALLAFALWQALRNWVRAEVNGRSLLAAGIAAIVAFSVGSWSNQGWTLPPLAALGWLILGSLSSPLLTKNDGKAMQVKTGGGQG